MRIGFHIGISIGVLATCGCSAYAAIPDLQIGASVNSSTLYEIAGGSAPYATARSGQRQYGEDTVVSAFLVPSNGGVVYSLSDEANLYATPYPSGGTSKRWPLSWWEDAYIEPPLSQAEYPEDFDLYQESLYLKYPGFVNSPECPGLGESRHLFPLRYGALVPEAESMLIAIPVSSFFVVAPSTGKVVFSVRLASDGWLTRESTKEYFSIDCTTSDGQRVDETCLSSRLKRAPQFQSSAAEEITNGPLIPAPGLREYAKLYVGDFDGNGRTDLIVWGKSYKSRMGSDPIVGFVKLRDTVVHYEYISPEFKRRTTKPETIRGWLTARQLTWSKGWPNKSECPGQTNQLIPEMHDPLLNDPEVLQ